MAVIRPMASAGLSSRVCEAPLALMTTSSESALSWLNV